MGETASHIIHTHPSSTTLPVERGIVQLRLAYRVQAKTVCDKKWIEGFSKGHMGQRIRSGWYLC